MVRRSLLVVLFVLVGAALSGSLPSHATVLRPRECGAGGAARGAAPGCPDGNGPVCAAGCRALPLTTFENICAARAYSAQHRETLLIARQGSCPCQ